MMDTDELVARFDVIEKSEFRGEVSLQVPSQMFWEVSAYCRDSLGLDYLLCVTGVDYPKQEPRFVVCYELCNAETGEHLRLKTQAVGGEVPSVSDVWPAADWHEREVFDMMGIRFDKHPDLRRILMWEGFSHYPLRKDFPAEGVPTEIADTAFTETAPVKGGPFVAATGTNPQEREPRGHNRGGI